MNHKQNYFLIFVWCCAFTALAFTTIEQILVWLGDSAAHSFVGLHQFLWLGVLGDFTITIGVLGFRFFIVDPEKFSEAILETDIQNNIQETNQQLLKPMRYLNWMPMAAIFGTIATAAIQLNFYLGMVVYLLDQLCLIAAFSGIIHLNRKRLLGDKNYLLVLISWIVIAAIITLTMILPGWGIGTLLLLPYICALIFMTILSFFAFLYTDRSLKYRLGLCIGACFFVFSDSIIGYSAQNPFDLSFLLIRPTYKLAVFFLHTAVLFFRSKTGDTVWKEE
ncbi:MAG: lysoplasmalogenase family protein [Promethearchaeota archaeon]